MVCSFLPAAVQTVSFLPIKVSVYKESFENKLLIIAVGILYCMLTFILGYVLNWESRKCMTPTLLTSALAAPHHHCYWVRWRQAVRYSRCLHPSPVQKTKALRSSRWVVLILLHFISEERQWDLVQNNYKLYFCHWLSLCVPYTAYVGFIESKFLQLPKTVLVIL